MPCYVAQVTTYGDSESHPAFLRLLFTNQLQLLIVLMQQHLKGSQFNQLKSA